MIGECVGKTRQVTIQKAHGGDGLVPWGLLPCHAMVVLVWPVPCRVGSSTTSHTHTVDQRYQESHEEGALSKETS